MKVNTRIYKAVYALAEKLMKAAEKEDSETFATLYRQLEEICQQHEGTEKDHPEQWETLADFTEEYPHALAIYQKALTKATAIKAYDHMASIGLSMATLYVELDRPSDATESLRQAALSAENVDDPGLKAEIAALNEKIEAGLDAE